MALVITLALLVLATMIVVAFITATRFDRVASANYSDAIAAEQIGQGGLSLILSNLKQEMAKDGTPATVGGLSIYTNITPANILPQRVGTDNSSGTLIKISTNAPFYTNSTSNLRASAISSTTENPKTRAVRLTRWDRPSLYTFTNSSTAPAWVYMTRIGPTNGVGMTFGPSGSTVNNRSSGNSNYILGRFAYAVYDVGGLLDITVAGHPSKDTDLSNADIARKGSLALADLTEIPGLSSQTLIDSLVMWRNKASISASYTNYLYNIAPTNGFLRVSPGDNLFLSRSDLISYAKTNGFTEALPYLTTFSRELNSISFNPSTNSTANPDFRKLIYNGKPLSRFSLSRFKLLDQNPASLSSEAQADILKYFGLTPSAGASETWRSWQYRTTSIGTPQDAINSGRDPDLFELLKAAVTNGSLGTYLQDNGFIRSATSSLSGTTTPYPPESNVDLQVARIVANIIDQYDTDNYPTTIQMGSPPTGNTVYGIENLPYFSEFLVKAYYPSRTLNDSTGAQFHAYFELWNPHRGMTPSIGPSQIRIAVNPEAAYSISYIKYATSGASEYGVYTSTGMRAFPATPIEIGSLSNYLEPHIVVNTANSSTYRSGMTIDSGPTGFNSLLLAPPERNMPTSFNDPASGVQNFLSFHIQTASFYLQYRDGDGNWRTYSTFAGHANDGGATGMQDCGIYMGDGSSLAANTPGSTANRIFNSRIDQPNIGASKPDPRTYRFRTGWWRTTAPITFNMAMVSGTDPGSLFEQYYPGDFPAPRYGGMLYKNSGAGNPIQTDRDNVSRKGDGYLSSTSDSANPMQPGSSARPIILNRPFRSVGDLGYVFRDAPWKSLNFFSSDTGDAGLLDLFSLEETEITAGKVNFNTPYPEILRALIKGASRDELGSAAPITSVEAAEVADDILAKTSTTPFVNRSEFIAQCSSSTVDASNPAIKSQREAPVRALASVTQTRTWNLMIDIIAQSGRFAPSASNLEEFIAEGERRYWLHVAIDRVTGQIIETQIEPVYE